MKVKVYAKNRPEKVSTIKVESREDLETVNLLAKSEVFRSRVLKDIDYEEMRLVFKIDGEKMSPKDVVSECASMLNGDSSKKNKDEKSGKKKKKKKNKDKDDGKKSKKKKGKKKDGKKKDKKKKPKLEYEDGYVHMTRAD